MKFQVVRENLSKALGIANKAISVKASLPILQNVLLQNDEGRLKIVSTDLDKSIITWIGAKIEGEGSLTIPARALHAFVSGLSDEQIFGEIKDSHLILKTNKSQATFNGMSSSEYPTLDYSISKDHFVINSDILKRAVDETYFSANVDDSSNPEWTGILLRVVDNALHFVGLDGFRLSKKHVFLNQLEKSSKKFKEVIIPSKNFLEIVRLSPSKSPIKIDIQLSKSTVVFDLGDLFFISKVLDGEFPDYEKVIPAEHIARFDVDYAEFLSAVKLSLVFAKDNNAIRINVNVSEGNLEILSDDAELGNNRLTVGIKNSEGENVEMAFNAKYLLDYLNNVPSDELTVKISGQTNPVAIIPKGRDDYIHVAVPLQVYWE